MSSGSNDNVRLEPKQSFPQTRATGMAQHGNEPTPEATECLVVEGAAQLAVTDQLVGRHDTVPHTRAL